ncbi:MAG: RNA methyltransferase [Candidatus Aminicenantales bacterium]
MKLPHGASDSDSLGRKRFAVILSHPESQENIGLAARAMKNTGFGDLRIVGGGGFEAAAFRTAVHSEGILKKARFFPDVPEAVKTLNLVFAATARSRNTFSILTFPQAVEAILGSPRTAKIGLLFGNERTGLTSEELGAANFVFTIPQHSRQPSYNLASAVLLTLFAVFVRSEDCAGSPPIEPLPLSRAVQDDCIRVILMKLEKNGFIHKTNKAHVTEMVQGLFGRLALTEKDQRFLMAVFNKGIE